MKFITKTNCTADFNLMKSDLDTLLIKYPWPVEDIHKKTPGNQIGVTHRPGAEDPYLDAMGGLYDKATNTFIAKESDFSEFNSNVGTYTQQAIKDLAAREGITLGRIRYMRLMPKTGLSVHPDFEARYHFVLETNQYAMFGDATPDDDLCAKCYHIPADGHFYKVDTTRPHFVYNGGWEPRIHLVVCAV